MVYAVCWVIVYLYIGLAVAIVYAILHTFTHRFAKFKPSWEMMPVDVFISSIFVWQVSLYFIISELYWMWLAREKK